MLEEIKGLMSGTITLEDIAEPVIALFTVADGMYTLKGGSGLDSHIGKSFTEETYKQFLRPKDRAILFIKRG